MTQKELSYIEDAIGHEKNIITICSETINFLQNEELKEFMQKQHDIHQEMCNHLISTLEVQANDR